MEIITFDQEPFCGEVVHIEVRPDIVTGSMRHNCGGPNYSYVRPLGSGEWNALVLGVIRADFRSLPPEIKRPESLDGNIPVVTDDTRQCIDVVENGTARRVCGWSYDNAHSAEGARLLSIIRSVQQIASRPRG
jgi:hypothetical protein